MLLINILLNTINNININNILYLKSKIKIKFYSIIKK